MAIRGDLKEVEGLIDRLISIGAEFRTKDTWWSHLKNNEDYDEVWSIEDQNKKTKIERIYAEGRDIALFMSYALESINFDFTQYPTLTTIIEHFQETWIDLDLETRLIEAKEAYDSLGIHNWAFSQMAATFEEQIKLCKVVKQTLNSLKQSNLYKIENGIPVDKENPSIIFGNVTNSNISLNSDNSSQNVTVNENIFPEIIDAIKASSIINKEPLITATENMAQESKTGSIAESYKNFITLAANHMSIIAPFIPSLTQLL